MDINAIHSYLVHPGKHDEEQPHIRGTAVEKRGRLFDMLKKVFDNAEQECQHDIAFVPDKADAQRNECRDCVLAYVKNQHINEGRKLAERLHKVTTHRSGLGLLFLMAGREKGNTKVVISRFPADSGILADEKEKGLTVEFLERIFMKSATAYKSAVYSGHSYDKDFWKGKAVDKQVNTSDGSISNYWIREFLRSDFLTPGEAGTRRFAISVREAMNRTADNRVKEEVAAMCLLIGGLRGRVISAKEALDQFNVSDITKEEIKDKFSRQNLFDEHFRFVPDEFSKHLAFKTVELDTGGLLTASTDRFNEVFTKEIVDKRGNVFRFTAQGKIVDQRFRKAKS